MIRRLLALALVAAGCGDGAGVPRLSDMEAERQLEAAVAAEQAAVEPLPAALHERQELRERLGAREKELEHAPLFGGGKVWPAIAEPLAREVFETAATAAGAKATVELAPPAAGALGFTVKVDPARRTLAVATALLADEGARPAALLARVDAATGVLSGSFPLDGPAAAPPGPPPPAAEPRLPAPTPLAAKLAAELEELRRVRSELLLASAETAGLRHRLGEAERMIAVHQRVGTERLRQRRLLEAVAALRPGPEAIDLSPEGLAARFGTTRLARGAQAQLPAGLAGEMAGELLRVRFAGAPPELPPYEERRDAAAAAIQRARTSGTAKRP